MTAGIGLRCWGWNRSSQQSAVRHFQEGDRRADQLPVLAADVFLSNGGGPDLNGSQNLAGIDADGLRMRIALMMEEYGQDVHHVLQQDPDNFPYEYYSVEPVHRFV